MNYLLFSLLIISITTLINHNNPCNKDDECESSYYCANDGFCYTRSETTNITVCIINSDC